MTRTRRIASRYVCLAGLLVLAAALGQVANDRLASIAAALGDHQFQDALELLRPALEQFPGDSRLWTMQGTAYSGLGKKTDALASFRRALKFFPNNILALHGAAQIEYDAGSADGIPLLQHLLRLQPDDMTSHGMLAVLEYQQGNCSAAVPHFEKAAALFESRLPALHAYATCLVRLKQFDKAASVFQRALALNPDDRRERQVLASVQLMAQTPQEALITLQPMLSDNPDSATLDLASAAYEAEHDTDKAVDALRQAILLDPHNVSLYVQFATIAARHQSFRIGINVVNEGINLVPNAAQLYFARGVLHVQVAEYDQAEEDFGKAYELDPSQSLTVAAQGLAAIQRNEPSRALEDVQKKLARKPDDPILLYMQADILTQQGAAPGSPEFQTALRSAKKAVALRPLLGPARGVLAKLYLQDGQYAEAKIQCRKALEINPKDQTALYHLIQALRKAENKNEIPDLLKRLAQLRQDATKDEREQYRYKLVEGDPESK